jgi:hypothetical protein
MSGVLRILSFVCIVLGIVHISFAFPITEFTTDLLWFIGAGFAISFAGVINLLALNNSGSRSSQVLAFVCNVLVCAQFILSLSVLKEPQVYFGIVLYLLCSVGFLLRTSKG